MSSGVWEIGLLAFTTLFATVSPIDVAALFAAMTMTASSRHKRAMAVKGVLIATGILLAFALFGKWLLSHLGITVAALRTAGGILLLLIALDMVFAKPSGGSSATEEEKEEGIQKKDISVFPLATPLIAGPGTMSAVILLMAEQDDYLIEAAVIAALLIVLAITLVCLLAAAKIQNFLGITGLNVVSRVIGVLLAALAVQFIFDGIRTSGLIPGVS
jgi:multiple antibiotic resistance protein